MCVLCGHLWHVHVGAKGPLAPSPVGLTYPQALDAAGVGDGLRGPLTAEVNQQVALFIVYQPQGPCAIIVPAIRTERGVTSSTMREEVQVFYTSEDSLARAPPAAACG